jgi:hypothetical protein
MNPFAKLQLEGNAFFLMEIWHTFVRKMPRAEANFLYYMAAN